MLKSASIMTASNLAEAKMKNIASALTFGLIKNDIKMEIKKLEKSSKELKKKAILIAKKYGIISGILLIFSFLGYFRVTTILLSIGALISLINGLITPILMITVHTNIDYLGDVILSFESKGIIGSIEKFIMEETIQLP